MHGVLNYRNHQQISFAKDLSDFRHTMMLLGCFFQSHRTSPYYALSYDLLDQGSLAKSVTPIRNYRCRCQIRWILQCRGFNRQGFLVVHFLFNEWTSFASRLCKRAMVRPINADDFCSRRSIRYLPGPVNCSYISNTISPSGILGMLGPVSIDDAQAELYSGDAQYYTVHF